MLFRSLGVTLPREFISIEFPWGMLGEGAPLAVDKVRHVSSLHVTAGQERSEPGKTRVTNGLGCRHWGFRA